MSVSHTTVNIGREKDSGLNNYNSTVYNKRKKSLNKRCVCSTSQQCHMQTPLSRKLQHVDTTSTADLTMEIAAMVKNISGLLYPLSYIKY